MRPDEPCMTCSDEPDEKEKRNECQHSKYKDCGHHCNCMWDQDKCCWCGAKIEDL